MFDSALCDMKNYAGLERWSGRGVGRGGEGGKSKEAESNNC